MKLIKPSVIYAPLWFFYAYILLTFSIALFGPVEFLNFQKEKTALYIVFIIFCCGAGYFYGVNSAKRLTIPPPEFPSKIRKTIPKSFDIILYAAVISTLVYGVSAVVGGSFNANVMALGETYSSSYEGYQRNTGSYSLLFIAYSIFSVPVFIASIWGIFHFKQLDKIKRLMVLFVVLGTVVIFTLGSGKMKQLGDLVIYIIAISAIVRAASGRGFDSRFIFTLFTVAILGIALFVFIVSQRYSVVGIDVININENAHWRMRYDTEHPAYTVFGSNIGFSVSVMSSYLSQGYYGLGLTLESPMTWSHFAGSSYSISVILERLFGVPSGYDVSYPYVTGVETGWGESKWYSVFPWFASDFTFIGTGLLFGLFSFWYARSWLESAVLSDPYAVMLFTLMTVGVFYVPANNQLMHSPGALATLICVVGLYIWSGPRRRLIVRRIWAPRKVPGQTAA